jgi:glycerol-3-phosphate dehydrogenase
MQRNLSRLSDHTFDLAVVGGGVLGACVARDAALRGLTVALVERHDFASGTSANSLKVVHGGLRQLQHLDLRGMRISARERAAWLRTAPHLVEPIPVVVPLTGGTGEALAYRTALAMNDMMSAGTDEGLPLERTIPPGRILSREECLTWVPELDGREITGGALFHDAVMHSAERLVLAVVRGAVEAGAVCANHMEVVEALRAGGRRVGFVARDLETGEDCPIRARVVVNGAGPWAPALTHRLLGHPLPDPPALSLAWNLVLPALGHQVAFALPGKAGTPTGSGSRRPRRLFLLPWRGRTLVGTGHAPFGDDPSALSGVDLEHPALRDFLDEVNRAWPGPPLTTDQVLLTHLGLLPAHRIASPGGADAPVPSPVGKVRLLGGHRIAVAADGGVPVLTATTVKFTRARQVAEEVVDQAAALLGIRDAPCRTADTPLPGVPDEGVPALLDRARRELGDILPPDVVEHLARSHGTAYPEVVALRSEDPAWDRRISPDAPVIRAELLHAVRREMARTQDDLLLRRCELGPRGLVDAAARMEAAEILAQASLPIGTRPR